MTNYKRRARRAEAARLKCAQDKEAALAVAAMPTPMEEDDTQQRVE